MNAFHKAVNTLRDYVLRCADGTSEWADANYALALMARQAGVPDRRVSPEDLAALAMIRKPKVADEDTPCLCTRKGDYEDVRGCPVHDA